jgi:uncharacterized protein (DUF1330 family)
VNSSDPLIFAPIDVQAAITYLGYTNGFGVINLFTTVQYPFTLQNPNLQISNTGLSSYISINSTNNCPVNTSCITTYEIQVNQTSGSTCYLNGTYNLTFNIACNSNWGQDCPLQNNSAQIVFQVTSENLCGIFTEQVSISATLNTYASDSSSVTQETFLENQIMYLRAVVTSNQVALASTYILNCSSIFEANSATTLLYSGGNSSNGGQFSTEANNAGLSFTFNNQTQANFQLNATSELYPVATDSYSSAVISCWIGVEYQNVSVKRSSVKEIRSYYSAKSNMNKLSGKILKRQGPSTNSQATAADARFAILQFTSATQQPTSNTQQINNASTNSQSIILMNLILFVFVLFFKI